jgi:Flp pilus assembly protein TadB
MAQTKRKRRSKHRGTAAGTIEARGRTGRKPTATEKKASKSEQSREQRLARLDRPPTWRSAANRALIAAAVFLVAVIVLFKQKPLAAVSLAAFMVLVYLPMGYYTDLFMYRRRQKQKAKKVAEAKQARRGEP